MLIMLVAMLFGKGIATAQSVEYYAGDKRTGVDLLWFRYFKNKSEKPTRFLFFSRNRASVDYTNNSGLFGSTNAVSYNFKNGIGLVFTTTFTNYGATPKAGVQYFKQKNNFMFFGWLVADIKEKGNIDLFGLFRYTPVIIGQWRLFSQLELFPYYSTQSNTFNFTERLRLGPKYNGWGVGFMADFNQLGTTNTIYTNNLGGYIRYDF